MTIRADAQIGISQKLNLMVFAKVQEDGLCNISPAVRNQVFGEVFIEASDRCEDLTNKIIEVLQNVE